MEPRGVAVLTQSFADAVAEAEKIITGAPHVRPEADLAEGYDYLAGNIRAALQLAWAYQRDFPYFVSPTGPYTKMGLDNPDTLYFHSYLRDDAEYVVTGRRGTTTDLSFQVLDGDYSPVAVPGSLLASQFSSAGHYDLGDDQAMIVTVPAAGRRVAPYQGIQLGSMWYVSLDYINHQTSLTADQARTDPDGRLRFVISERDPGVANWLECTGHRRGYVQIRWQRLSRDLGPADGPQVEVVAFADLADVLPYHQQTRVTPAEHAARIAARQAAVAARMLG
jgi:hypothetical protein